MRLRDTRATPPRVWPDGTIEIDLPIATARALVTNITLAGVDGAGFVTAYPAGTQLPGTSSVNARARDATVPNFAITSVSTRGTGYFSSSGTDLIVDLTGYFTGTPVPATLPVPPNVAPNYRVLLVGDSTLAALNVVPSSQGALRGFEPVVDAEPCRRLVRPSCKSAYTLRVPNTAVEAIGSTPGDVDVVVIKTGYNDGPIGFEAAVGAVVDAARAKGARWVVWLTYSEGPGTPGGTYEQNTATLHRLAGSAAFPDLIVADWRSYAALSSGWYASDRLHLHGAGAWATSDYISRWIAHLGHRPCPMPWNVGGPLDDPCPSPDAIAAATGTLPSLKALYGF